jgi:tetratricopeptide (TPR) repeat protein
MGCKNKMSWRVVPIALLIFVCLLVGFENGQKGVAYQAFVCHDYGKALEIYAQVGDCSGAGMCYLAMNMPDEAIKQFQQGCDQSGLGLAHCKKRDYKTALQYFHAAGDHSGCGLAYMGLRDEAKAREHFTRVNDWSGLGLLALSKNDFVEAERCFEKVRDYSGLGLTALKQKKYAQARQWFAQAKDARGDGLVWLAERNHRKAAELLYSANDLSGLGYVYLATGNNRKAQECFLAANDSNGLGDLYSKLNQFEKAREMFEKDNNPVKVIQSFRNDYALPDRFQRAIAYGEKAVAEGRMPAECRLEMADIYYDMNQIDRALATLDQVAADPAYASEAHLFKGRILFFQRDWARAKAEFLQVKKDDMNAERNFADARRSLETIRQYEGLKLQAAQGY